MTFAEETEAGPRSAEEFGAKREEVVVLGQRYVIPRFDADGRPTGTAGRALNVSMMVVGSPATKTPSAVWSCP